MQKFIIGAAFLLLSAMPALADETPLHSIAVQGEATMKLAPDQATIDVGVLTQGTVVASALAENSTKMSKVVAALRTLGIKDADIHTSTFRIQPKYEKISEGEGYDPEALRPIIGYLVSNQVTVTVTDMTKIAKIIDDSVRAGANASGNVNFQVKDIAQYIDKVHANAVDTARHKAEVLAAAAHVGLGSALSITDNMANTYYHGQDYSGGGLKASVLESVVLTPILPGQVEISAAVTVVYATK